ncbi:hypothetical protein C8Q78DRAFT_1027308 [Trametes maxima]|nr:hypothetical protein C8Q78DRAFT_1027308 [Trametes maxima]
MSKGPGTWRGLLGDVKYKTVGGSEPTDKLEEYNPWHGQPDERAGEPTTNAPTPNDPPPIHPLGQPGTHLRMFHGLPDPLSRDHSDEPSWATLFRHLPGVMLAFAGHVVLRGRYPRRLPPLTSLGVREIYAGIALAWAVENASFAYTRRLLYDPDLRPVELSALNIRRALCDPKYSPLVDLDNYPENGLLTLRKWHEAMYRDLDIFGKIHWWHNHMWSDTTTWMTSAAIFIAFYNIKGLAKEDVDVCVTHIANTRCSNLSEEFVPMYEEHWLDLRDYTRFPLGLLALSVPLGMFARRTGRPMLFRPINGLQRLLFGATLYAGTMQKFQHHAYPCSIRDKHSLAQRIRRA